MRSPRPYVAAQHHRITKHCGLGVRMPSRVGAGNGAGRAGGGGGTVCCVVLPAEWQETLRVRVEWVEQNWRDCSYRLRQREVAVAPYEEPGRLWVHFLADDSMQLVVLNVGTRNT
ncbi:DUF3304 domain-containing protein [Luteimonas yindakuii]|uniref:DUF3304 domain-containing protein n=1 Tax=Luteimonas yindakuii TaxID=2565782 RepID=UPI0010A52995|nr:DUF3304 domain-containing protein [Luteimonas yindakuii]